jgi:2-keto-3-deoxy-galactonokinase
MYIFYFDCGTSRTRGYLLKNGEILIDKKKEVGSKDVSINNNKRILVETLKELYDEILDKVGISDDEVKEVYASGMVTSPYGLVVVPHIEVPVDKIKMKNSLYKYREESLFKRNIYLLPGLKTMDPKTDINIIHKVNNVRGEEIEAIGVSNYIPENWKNDECVIILPGSHTHSILMKRGEIVDIFSTFSGELFHALTTSTILSNSTYINSNNEKIDCEIVEKGCKYFKEYGISRAIYIIHAMKVFELGYNSARRDCLSGIINGSVVDSIIKQMQRDWKDVRHVIVYGDTKILEIFDIALNVFSDIKSKDRILLNREKYNCSVKGLMSIISENKS